ncbi:sugar phosphate isomerase/epimerase family protein [Erythrobacter crassostreae]|uniref:Sugar phosphate isomerase/epimerase n=1 Tax=Erythrobacter crassostreae TaxID=2828328 RepID=A0A9X1F6G2_9SPHN|nr:sugar phosphate isomerase/epimerase [Erythrobacter crassostrea]MBV7260338.1 sugar phosphate isomerase/epimerase [Erythrobacter crassostrea]
MNIRTDRRAFMGSAALVGLGALSGCTAPAGETDADRTKPVYDGLLGVQLYTVREMFEADPKATLEALAEIGFKDCETAGLFEHKATDIRAMMDDLGLVSRSAHVRLPQLREGFSNAIEEAGMLGQDRLYLGWIPEEERSLDKYRALAELLNQRGEEAKAAGMMVGYHNHEFEFIDVAGTSGYDILLAETDPELVTMEIDFFWAAEAGINPAALFDKAPGRFTSCHIKDRTSSGDMVSVGDGVIDFASYFELAETAGLERFYVEHDNPEDALASVGRSHAYLMK